MTTTLAESGLSGSRGRVKRLNLLVFGRPGSAKTPLVHGLPRTRTLDFDDGMQSVEWAILSGHLKKELSEIVYETILPPDDLHDAHNKVYDQATIQIDEWLAEEDIPAADWDKPYEQMWDTLIIDSGTALTDASKIKALKENSRLKLSKSLKEITKGGLLPMKIQDWGATGFMFQKFITFCRTIGKNLVLVCHEYTEEDDTGTVRAILPFLQPKGLRSTIPKDFDEIWYTNVKGTRNAPKFVFQTTPDPLKGCRSRLGCLDAEEESDFQTVRKKIADFYHVDEDILWKAAHGSEERAALRAEEEKESVAI